MNKLHSIAPDVSHWRSFQAHIQYTIPARGGEIYWRTVPGVVFFFRLSDFLILFASLCCCPYSDMFWLLCLLFKVFSRYFECSNDCCWHNACDSYPRGCFVWVLSYRFPHMGPMVEICWNYQWLNKFIAWPSMRSKGFFKPRIVVLCLVSREYFQGKLSAFNSINCTPMAGNETPESRSTGKAEKPTRGPSIAQLQIHYWMNALQKLPLLERQVLLKGNQLKLV